MPLPDEDDGLDASGVVGVGGRSPADGLRIADGRRLDLGGTIGGGTAVSGRSDRRRYGQGDLRELGCTGEPDVEMGARELRRETLSESLLSRRGEPPIKFSRLFLLPRRGDAVPLAAPNEMAL